METTHIQAAGGFLEDHSSGILKIAVIFRDRYGGEWGLPKGKLKNKETLTETAVREVQEETGCDVSIGEFAGCTSYDVGESIKTVLFWKMSLKTKRSFQPNDETKMLDWLPPEEAIERVTHQDEKDLIRQTYLNKDSFEYGDQTISYRGRINRLFSSSRWCRLKSAITAYEIELSKRICHYDGTDHCWKEAAAKALKQSKRALYDGNIDLGWKTFHAARRMELFGLDNVAELPCQVAILKEEAEKLSGWRRRAIDRLLGVDDRETPNVENIYQAALIRDEHYTNQAFKIRVSKNHSIFFSVFLIAILVGLLSSVYRGLLPQELPQTILDFKLLFAVFLFGLLGGAISAVIRFPGSIKEKKIPELTETFQITLLRLLGASASAIVMYLILRSGIVQAYQLKPGIVTIYVICFVAGFTERLILNAVSSIEK